MTPRGRNKIQIITISLIVIIFIIYQIFSNSHMFWKTLDSLDENERIFMDKDVTRAIFKVILKHPKSKAFHGKKLIHLDLKGAPPLVSYYKVLFPFIRKLGATGILIEYEDMFYYKDELEDLRALNAYQPSDIKTILELADINNLMAIPLIQTFGHFEFVLKLEKFKDLRENIANPQVLCVSHERALPLIKKMIDQILEAHPKAKYIHIGCDEVRYFGECDKCKSVLQKNFWNTNELFLNHVKNIALYIRNIYSEVRPIVWGDIIGGLSENVLKESGISNMVDLMVWKYATKVPEYITDDMLQKYAKVFKSVWIASAFKGATGVNQKITDVQYHLKNQISWMEIVSRWEKSINFKGIAVTGWQRYDHFAELCELLPVGIPSLSIMLTYLNGTESGTTKEDILDLLKCDHSFKFSPFIFDHSTKYLKCDFPGFLVYQLINRFHSLSIKIRSHFSVINSGWFSIYNIFHKFGSPTFVKSIFDNWPVNEHLMQLKELERDLRKALLEIYDEFTVDEWMTTYLTPLRIRLEAFCYAKEGMFEQDVWPRRPLLNKVGNLEKAAKEICASDRKFGCALLLI